MKPRIFPLGVHGELAARSFPLWVLVFLEISLLVAVAKPRPPLPPLPEPAPLLMQLAFDEPFWFGLEQARTLNTAYSDLVESWSGYALRRGETALQRITPFVVPALDSTGRTNVACAEGSIRFFYKSSWSSAVLAKGGGPRVEARLLELTVVGNKETAVWWSLGVSPDGSALRLVGETGTGLMDLLTTEIAWRSGESHLVTLNYGPKATALFIDQELVAEGAGVVTVPPDVIALSIGSTLIGTDTAGGEFDEVCAFARPLAENEVRFYCQAFGGWAGLGPITAEEEAARKEAAAARRLAEGDGVSQNRALAMLSSTNCVTNGPVYLTNVFCTLDTNGNATVTFDILGGTNGLVYDIFSTTNLAGVSITNSVWWWLEKGPTCYTYQYTNLPNAVAFYVVGTPQDSDGDGLTDAYETLVSKTDKNTPSNPDTDGDGIPDLWEFAHGLNPCDPNDAGSDFDSDGFSNLEEYLRGSDPRVTAPFAVLITSPKPGSNLP